MSSSTSSASSGSGSGTGSGFPIVVVFGATGSQGGAVISQLLKYNKFRVRGITRTPQSAASKKLVSLGVEMMKGDANDPASLLPCFRNAWGAFLVTNFWDAEQKLNPETDWIQGKNMVDAALGGDEKKTTIQMIVWSSLHDVAALSGGSLEVPHYTNKNRVEQYVRSKSNSTLQCAFVYAGFYTTNWINFPPLAGPQRNASGQVEIRTAVRADVAIPIIDVELDFGQFVGPLFLFPSRYNGAKILAASEYLTVSQMAQAYTRVTSEQVELIPIDVKEVGVAELRGTQILFNLYGYFGGEHLEPSRKMYDHIQLHSFENWLQRSKFKP